MRKKNVGVGFATILLVLCLLTTFTIIIAACSSSSSSSSGSAGPNTVLLEDHTFNPSSITIKKGDSITLTYDQGNNHIIENGTWIDGVTEVPKQEPNAPKVDLQIGNGSQAAGPFDTAGTFQLLCTVHQGMNLTVYVT